ncbi:hypothetical protein AB0I53_38710 [Saccharopolyspora sp. NPDC050389]|uniref:hypothetical protein n=1 Tax=Saccharopolyspora sp. NPDC050389 TaxID=3155516 RepID=UPI0033C9F98A
MAEAVARKHLEDFSSLLDLAERRSSTVMFEGYVAEDKNVPGNLLIVQSPNVVYSVAKSDVVERENIDAKRVRAWVRPGVRAYRISPFTVGEVTAPLEVAMEFVAAPPTVELPGTPVRGDPSTLHRPPPQANAPLSAVGAYYEDGCAGGDNTAYANNCAHFLSNAFIRAGYAELSVANPHIHARCTPGRRPLRARNMWSWLQEKAVRTSTTLQPNTGWWAVFQLKESAYWGGHVVLLDSDTWAYYGTSWHDDWGQHLYQW